MIDINNIDIELLRKDLENHFISIAFVITNVAFMDLERVRNASDEELVEIALKNGYDLTRYTVNSNQKTH